MVAHFQMTEYSIISQKTIHSSEIDTVWLLNLSKWFLFLKSSIYGSDKWLLNILQQNGSERKSWWYVNFYTNTEESVVLLASLFIYYLLDI